MNAPIVDPLVRAALAAGLREMLRVLEGGAPEPPREPSEMEKRSKDRITAKEAAEILGVSVQTVYDMGDRGALRAFRPGGAKVVRFSRAEVEQRRDA